MNEIKGVLGGGWLGYFLLLLVLVGLLLFSLVIVFLVPFSFPLLIAFNEPCRSQLTH